MMGSKVGQPADNPNHKAAFPQGAEDEETRRQDEKHRGFASDEFRSGKTAEKFPGPPYDRIHTLRP